LIFAISAPKLRVTSLIVSSKLNLLYEVDAYNLRVVIFYLRLVILSLRSTIILD